VFLQPIYFGASRDNIVLGVLAVGFEVDNHLAEAVARVASCQSNLLVKVLPLQLAQTTSAEEFRVGEDGRQRMT
jgi:hypothetical protein